MPGFEVGTLFPDSGSDREAEDEGIERDEDEAGFKRSGICQKIYRVSAATSRL